MDQKIGFSGWEIEGGPFIPPLSLESFNRILMEERNIASKSQRGWWNKLRRLLDRADMFLGWPHIDCNDLSQAKWGVVLPEEKPEFNKRLIKALSPLIEHRAQQTESPPEQLIFTYRRNETGGEWLKRHGVESAEQNPEKTPYYLLLIGNPKDVPFSFQYELVQHAIGRLSLPTLKNYRNYAKNIVEYEQTNSVRKNWVLCAPKHDYFTTQSSKWLMSIMNDDIWKTRTDRVENFIGEDATKANILQRFNDLTNNSELFFFAGHGVHHFPSAPEEQQAVQGAFVFQPTSTQNVLTADEVNRQLGWHNNIIFTTACHGAGTPSVSDFSHWWSLLPATSSLNQQNAWVSLIASLPQKFLGLERPALAYVGHIDVFTSLTLQKDLFSFILNEIWLGHRIGYALRHLRDRVLVKSFSITEWIDAKEKYGYTAPPEHVIINWILRNDARNFILLGDPAVSLITLEED
jgi:hypothetical protein